MENGSLPDKVCTQCLERNLTTEIIPTFLCCKTCKELFCQHGASRLDPQYCSMCLKDIQITDTIETEIRTQRNELGQVTSERHFRVRHLKFEGLDWLFYNRAIATMNDQELTLAIEYHQAIYQGMIHEREVRRINNFQRNRGKIAGNEQAPIIDKPFNLQNGQLKFTGAQAPKVVNKAPKATQAKVVAKPSATNAIATLLAAGLTQEQIQALVKGKK